MLPKQNKNLSGDQGKFVTFLEEEEMAKIFGIISHRRWGNRDFLQLYNVLTRYIDKEITNATNNHNDNINN